jgi:hypothetical protein
MKFYIAGPMRGIPQFNFPAFFEAERLLRADDHDVFNPARHDLEVCPTMPLADGFAEGDIDRVTAAVGGAWSFATAMRWDLARITEADMIYLLDGWERSEGVKHELYVAKAIGVPVYKETPDRRADHPRRIIGLSGFARAGKDTVADRLVEVHGFTKVAFADPMREMMLALDPWLSTPDYGTWARLGSAILSYGGLEEVKPTGYGREYRRLMQRLGTEAGRGVLGEDVWVDAMRRRLAVIDGDVVISDVRFENEAALIHELGGVVWRVERPELAPDGHASENGLPDEAVDAVLFNGDSIETLYDRLARAVVNL